MIWAPSKVIYVGSRNSILKQGDLPAIQGAGALGPHVSFSLTRMSFWSLSQDGLRATNIQARSWYPW